MDKMDSLAQLKDIHLSDPIGWWPLAPGWYGLMLVFIVAGIFLAFEIQRRRRHARPKNQALELLKNYRQQYEKEKNTQKTSAYVSELLRRVSLVYFPRNQVASLHGEEWIVFLNETSKQLDFRPVQSMLLESPFKTAESIDLTPLLDNVEEWIKQRRIPCSN